MACTAVAAEPPRSVRLLLLGLCSCLPPPFPFCSSPSPVPSDCRLSGDCVPVACFIRSLVCFHMMAQQNKLSHAIQNAMIHRDRFGRQWKKGSIIEVGRVKACIATTRAVNCTERGQQHLAFSFVAQYQTSKQASTHTHTHTETHTHTDTHTPAELG